MKPKTVHQFSFIAGRVKNSLEAAALLAVEFEMPEDVFIAYAKAAFQESQNYLDNADDADAEREEVKGLLQDTSEIEKEVDYLFERLALQPEFNEEVSDIDEFDVGQVFDIDIDEFDVGQVFDIDQSSLGAYGPVGRVVVTRVDEGENLVHFRWISGGFSEETEGRDDSAAPEFFTFGVKVADEPEPAAGQVWASGDDQDTTYSLTERFTNEADGATGWRYESTGGYAWLRDAYFTGDFAADPIFSRPSDETQASFAGFADDPNFVE